MEKRIEVEWTDEVPTHCAVTGEEITETFVLAKVSYEDEHGALHQETAIVVPDAHEYINEPGRIFSRRSDGKWIEVHMPENVPDGTLWAPFDGRMCQVIEGDRGEMVLLVSRDEMISLEKDDD